MAGNTDHVRAVLRKHTKEIHTKHRVVATGIGYKIKGGRKTDSISIICSVVHKRPAAELTKSELLPVSIDNVPLDVIQTGRIRAFQSRTERLRPAPGGASIGHFEITAGTLGCIVKRNGQRMILSNNHVLANSNDANIGDPILQPGPVDGGRLADDQIATLHDFVPIQFPDESSDCGIANGAAKFANALAEMSGSTTRLLAVKSQAAENLVDAAIAKPLQDQDITDDILDIGTITGTARGELGLNIKKSGRTTAFTTGVIEQIDVTVNVQYGPGRTALFTDQLLAGPMSQGGDSGSAILDEQNRVIGLLFAGSENSTIINHIEHVFSALRVSL